MNVRIVRHELCHGVQHQNHLPVDGPQWELSPDLDAHGSRREEAFAEACEDALFDGFLLGERCPADPLGIDALYETRDLFTGPDDVVEVEQEGALATTISVPTTSAAFDLQLTESGIRLLVDGEALVLDPWTGEPAPEEPATALESPDLAFTDASVLELYEISAPNGDVTTRRVYVDDSVAVVPLGCVLPEERVFAFDGSTWSVWLDGGAVRVGYWTVR